MDQGYLSEIFVSFQGEGARVGERHLFVRMAGCNLRCRYCDTPGSLVRGPFLTVQREGSPPSLLTNPIGSTELVRCTAALMKEEGPLDAVALTGGEPLVQADFLADFLAAARFLIPVLLETNGVLPEQLTAVLPWVDIVSMDIKPASNTGERPFWDEHDEFLRRAGYKEVYVKVLVDRHTSDADICQAAELLAAHGPVPLYLQPIMDTAGQATIDPVALRRLFLVARRIHGPVRVLPQTHKIIGIQ
ncbi:MAG: 7-carboxy-7-deazaguanine synthase QueE [Deltaproteobacteria bacterium]|nr:7-carboxy-7-deazaguanine synthase QueE [Deltaproteobacteria bacterium]